jgi:ubiquinone/menaquinone biosynthesis C-methylase UbiE
LKVENTDDKDLQFWAMRAKKYNKLEWANKSEYLRAFVEAGNFREDHFVLDVGTGTGIIAHTISPLVKKMIGIDISHDMIKQAADPKYPNIEWKQMDTHELDFADETFDRLTARMVFHHVTTDTQKAMGECFRVLKKGGKMVFSEGVPPTHHVVPFYTEMFKLKEDRITFMDEDLEALMRNAGFSKIDKQIYWSRQSSIKNWLENSGIPQENQDKIFQMHLDLDAQGKKDYNMTITEKDCLIDMKFVILTGTK